LVSSSASFSADDDDAKSVDLSIGKNRPSNRHFLFFSSLFERANLVSNTSHVRRLGFAQTRVVLALSRNRNERRRRTKGREEWRPTTKALLRVGSERPSESGVPVERPDESGQLERGTSGVCHSRRVGRGHRGRESGAVVSERARTETGARIRKKKKKKKKIASRVFYSTSHHVRTTTTHAVQNVSLLFSPRPF
jgi:hypothetical protein